MLYSEELAERLEELLFDIFPAIDCIMTPTKFEEKYLTDDFFIDEMPLSRFTPEEIETWNSILNTHEIITFTE